ncbi:MAG TPA: hypothetical protein VOB72_08265 [Candidatus Dormibacteraeota bacterium]|nr:hypothetical protein [Candidatus Dormibacteraeota bacterium]
MTPPKPRTPRRVCGGVFQLDPDVPPDSNGRATCRCRLVGEPGDAHHLLPVVPEQAAVAARYDPEEGEE